MDRREGLVLHQLDQRFLDQLEYGHEGHHHAEPPLPDEGTWGWDYHGYCLPSRVILGWWHGRKYQGGEGAYSTDGPRPLHAIEGRHERKGEGGH